MTRNPMETCKSLRGTSCRWTKFRQWRWIGIRPSGLGLRLKSRQLQPGDIADAGDKWPLDATMLPFAGTSPADDAFFGVVFVLGVSVGMAVRPESLREAMGLRLLVRALRRSGPSSCSSSSKCSSTGCGVLTLFLTDDRVTGAEYVSCDEAASSRRSEGVGLGDITRGVAGTPFRRDMS